MANVEKIRSPNASMHKTYENQLKVMRNDKMNVHKSAVVLKKASMIQINECLDSH